MIEILEYCNALRWDCQLARAALFSDNPVARRFCRRNPLVSISWAWGLSLIALTIAIHTTGVVVMALVGLVIRVRWLETPALGLGHVILMVIGAMVAVGTPLAVLHGIEALVWPAAYVWLGALNSPQDAILYSFELNEYARCFGADAATDLADDGRAGSGRRYAAVRHQHGLHFRGDASVPGLWSPSCS